MTDFGVQFMAYADTTEKLSQAWKMSDYAHMISGLVLRLGMVHKHSQINVFLDWIDGITSHQ